MAEGGDVGGALVQVCFPSVQASVLDSLNQQRERGHLCDLSIHVQGQVFKAHRCVLAASSPYFHDQVLLKNMSSVSIPAVMDPLAFESVLRCAYTGQLRMLRQDIVNYLTVGSVLQMWHIVDKCTELLREGRGAAEKESGGDTPTTPKPPSRPGPAFSESQSPSSTNYFSPRDASCGGGAVSAGGAGEGAVHSTPTYCMSSGGDGFTIEDEEEEEEEELEFTRKREQDERKSASEAGVSDSFGVSSYQGGDASPLPKRPPYSQPSIMPRKQWVVVKTEHPRDDDLIVVSGGEEGGEEEEEQRERGGAFNISNVRTLSGLRDAAEVEAQEFCQSSEDFLKYERSLMEQACPQAPPDGGAQCSGRPARPQLFPLDMQGNQILLYQQAALESSPSLASLRGGVEHGAGLDGLEGGALGSAGKVYLCHCGKTFTHKSMRDRHINMHLDLRPFHCPVCAKKFKMKHHLTEHMKTHTGLKPYHCPACAKKFMWRDSFMRHRSHCDRRGSEGVGLTTPGQASGGGVSCLGVAAPGSLLGLGSQGGSGGLGGGRGTDDHVEDGGVR